MCVYIQTLYFINNASLKLFSVIINYQPGCTHTNFEDHLGKYIIDQKHNFVNVLSEILIAVLKADNSAQKSAAQISLHILFLEKAYQFLYHSSTPLHYPFL